jgi:hypothetical protein
MVTKTETVVDHEQKQEQKPVPPPPTTGLMSGALNGRAIRDDTAQKRIVRDGMGILVGGVSPPQW